MADPLFVSQSKLEEWVAEGAVTFDDSVLTLLAHNTSYLMEEAARITEIIDGEDTAGLLNAVWSVPELEAKGAEYYHDSVLLGDTAYQCEAGFVGLQQKATDAAAVVAAPQAEAPPPAAGLPATAPASTPAPAPAAARPDPIALTDELPPPLPKKPATDPAAPSPGPASGGNPETDTDLLADFLLKNL